MGNAFGFVTSKEVVVAPWFKKPDVEFFDADKDYIDGISNNNAGLVIGDRTFNLKDSFLYQYDQLTFFEEPPYLLC